MEKYKLLYSPNGDVNLVPENINLKDRMEPGFYKVKITSSGMSVSMSITKDNTIEIPKSAMRIAKSQINVPYIMQYLSDMSKEIHSKLNLKHKMGYMLHGIQGTGKTTSCYAVSDYLIKKLGAVVITVTDVKSYTYAIDFLEEVKAKLGDFLTVTIFDECERDMYNYDGHFKRLLDSSSSLNNHIAFFTTNDIDLVPVAIKDRPSRIKFCTEITGIEDELIIHEILSSMNEPIDLDVKLSEEEIGSIVPTLKSKTLDEVKNSFLDTVFEINFKKKVLLEQAAQATL